MATERMITIDVDKKGNSKIEAHGFDDNTCLKATKSVEEALGVVGEQKLKPEGMKSPDLTQTLKVGGK